MSINPLPPQAYTKDTLAKAYQWLQGQPDEVKSLAKSSDLLVGLYLKAHRDGPQVLQGKSFQNFRQELKSLAEMVEDFVPSSGNQVYASPIPQAREPQVVTQQPSITQKSSAPQATPQKATQAPPTEPLLGVSSAGDSNSQPQASQASTPTSSSQEDWLECLDAKTLQYLDLVQKKLNLSSPMEALRMLVTLGYERVKSLFQ